MFRLVDANIIGIVIWDFQGRIIEANQAFLNIIGYAREDLASLRWTELTPAEWRDVDDQAFAELKATGTVQPREKEYFRKDGSRVPVLVARAIYEWNRDEGESATLSKARSGPTCSARPASSALEGMVLIGVDGISQMRLSGPAWLRRRIIYRHEVECPVWIKTAFPKFFEAQWAFFEEKIGVGVNQITDFTGQKIE
jgi:PAS domain S-box-containing protein